MEALLENRPVEAYCEAIFRELNKYRKMDNLKAIGHRIGVGIDSLID